MKTILAPLDFSDATADVAGMAATMTKSFAAKLVLIHVAAPEPEFIGYEPGPQSVRDSVARELAYEHRRIHEIEKELAARGIEVTALVMQGYPAEKIAMEAEKFHADMIVMGSHGHGALRHLLVGSVTEGVLRRVNCPVLVVPHHTK